MKLSADDIAEYQKIHEQIHGESISEEEARIQGMRLISYIEAVTHPLTRILSNKYND